jgi:hypothetical protein
MEDLLCGQAFVHKLKLIWFQFLSNEINDLVLLFHAAGKGKTSF